MLRVSSWYRLTCSLLATARIELSGTQARSVTDCSYHSASPETCPALSSVIGGRFPGSGAPASTSSSGVGSRRNSRRRAGGGRGCHSRQCRGGRRPHYQAGRRRRRRQRRRLLQERRHPLAARQAEDEQKGSYETSQSGWFLHALDASFSSADQYTKNCEHTPIWLPMSGHPVTDLDNPILIYEVTSIDWHTKEAILLPSPEASVDDGLL